MIYWYLLVVKDDKVFVETFANIFDMFLLKNKTLMLTISYCDLVLFGSKSVL